MMRVLFVTLLLLAGCAGRPPMPEETANAGGTEPESPTDAHRPFHDVHDVEATAATPFEWVVRLDAPARRLQASLWSEANAMAGISVSLADCGEAVFSVISVGSGTDYGSVSLCDELAAGDYAARLQPSGAFVGRVTLTGV